MTLSAKPPADPINTDPVNMTNAESVVTINDFFATTVMPFAIDYRAGTIAIVGRPNVGKSTLMNHLLGQKLSITSRKPQTTRHKILGIVSDEAAQMVFVDTPGMHKNTVRAINERMNSAATSALNDVDLVLFVVDAGKWRPDDEWVWQKLVKITLPIILVINKTDTLANKTSLLPLIKNYQQRFGFSDIVPVSALKDQNLTHLAQLIKSYLPMRPPLFDTEQLTDRSERFLASEMVREKIIRALGDEVPYDVTVQIDSFKDEPAHTDPQTGKPKRAMTFIDATIFVQRSGQKAIILGDKGNRLKQIGTEARLDMEKLFDKKIMLTLWVKIKKGWSDDERALSSLGY